MLNQQCDGVIGREYHGDIIQIELQRANNMRFGFGAWKFREKTFQATGKLSLYHTQVETMKFCDIWCVPYIYTLKPVNFGCAALHQKAIVSVVSLQLCVIDLKGLKLVYSLTGW